MTVEYIARQDVVTVTTEMPVDEVGTLLWEEGVGSAVVVDDDDPVGMVTDRDIATGVWEFDDPREATVEDVMSSGLVTIESDVNIYEALQTAREAGVRRLPVMNDGELSGIVTLDDVLVLIAGEMEQISGVLQSHSPPYE